MTTSNTTLLAQILQCGYSDVQFLIDLCEKNEIDLDIDDIKSNYWDMNVNILIYDAIQQIANRFFDEYKNQIEEILNIRNLEQYRSENDVYEIYTNYLDSHLWFKDEKVQALFEQSRYEV